MEVPPMHSSRAFPCLAAMALAAVAMALPVPAGAAGQNQSSYLTGPNEGSPRDIALAYVRAHAGRFGVAAVSDTDLVVTDQYTDAHNGVTHIYLRQAIGGIQVLGTEVNVNIAPNGSVMSAGG